MQSLLKLFGDSKNKKILNENRSNFDMGRNKICTKYLRDKFLWDVKNINIDSDQLSRIVIK